MFTHDAPRLADDRSFSRHILDDDGARSDSRMISHLNRAENRRARSNDDTIAQCRMPLAGFHARAAQRYAMEEEYVVADLYRFSNDDTHAVIDEAAPSNLGCRVNFNSGE